MSNVLKYKSGVNTKKGKKMVRTQICLDDSTHHALKREAVEENVSLAELIRRLVRDHLLKRSTRKSFKKEEFLSIVGLGESGERDVSVHHDQHIKGDAESR